jgi:hypothetical protein
MNNRKQISEADMRRMLSEGQVTLPPLQIACITLESQISGKRAFDALIEVRSGGQRSRFAVEMKASSTPIALRTAINEVKGALSPTGTLPMIMLPYLSESQLQELERAGISGMDLCGNGVVMAPGGIFVYRTGQPNRYPRSTPIKNIYRKNSSMVPRVFLAQSQFKRVTEVLTAINPRNVLGEALGRPPMAMGTVSKAIKSMEEDLIISREQGPLKLIQPDKLLEKLLENYQLIKPDDVIRRRVSATVAELPVLLASLGKELNLPVVATGLASATQYAVMQRGDMLSVYCPRPEDLLSRLSASESDRFPNLEIIRSEDETDYFDSRLDAQTGFRWASPIQAYLEMMRGDKRDQETATQVRAELIRQIRNTP